MKKAIKKHLGDFVAIIALVLLAFGVGGYVLANQRLHFPLVQKPNFVIYAQFDNAQSVQPGQGQTVRTAGVEIGLIGKVKVENGKADVQLLLKPKYKNYVRQNATALLRSKTGLKDMFVEIDPGTGKPLKKNGTILSRNTAPDTNPDEILSALDTDSRDYLKLLVSGAGKGLKGHGNDLQQTFARLGPTTRDLGRLNSAVALRRHNLKRLINRYGLLMTEVGSKDRDIVRLVRSSNDVFQSLAAEDNNISSTVAKLPGALNTTKSTLTKVDAFSQRLSPALNSLRPAIRELQPANKAVLPLVREATPEIRDQIRPFTRVATPFTKNLGSAAGGLAKATPDLTISFNKLNRLFNIGAFNPGGAEALNGDPTHDRNRQEGYLYWLAWTAQNTNSLFSTADASGPLRRITLGGISCSLFTAVGVPGTVSDLLGTAGVCTK